MTTYYAPFIQPHPFIMRPLIFTLHTSSHHRQLSGLTLLDLSHLTASGPSYLLHWGTISLMPAMEVRQGGGHTEGRSCQTKCIQRDRLASCLLQVLLMLLPCPFPPLPADPPNVNRKPAALPLPFLPLPLPPLLPVDPPPETYRAACF